MSSGADRSHSFIEFLVGEMSRFAGGIEYDHAIRHHAGYGSIIKPARRGIAADFKGCTSVHVGNIALQALNFNSQLN